MRSVFTMIEGRTSRACWEIIVIGIQAIAVKRAYKSQVKNMRLEFKVRNLYNSSFYCY